MLTKAHHWFLHWTYKIQSTSWFHKITVILSSHLPHILSLQQVSSLEVLQTKFCMNFSSLQFKIKQEKLKLDYFVCSNELTIKAVLFSTQFNLWEIIYHSNTRLNLTFTKLKKSKWTWKPSFDLTFTGLFFTFM